jgi:hypothetical protein
LDDSIPLVSTTFRKALQERFPEIDFSNVFDNNAATQYQNHPDIHSWIYLELPKLKVPISAYNSDSFPEVHLLMKEYITGSYKQDLWVDVIGLRKPGKLAVGCMESHQES